MSAKSAIRNKTWAELKVGDAASLERTCSVQDLFLFAHVSGNVNPLMLPSAEGGPKTDPVAPSMWVGSLVSAVLGNVLPGAGTLYSANRTCDSSSAFTSAKSSRFRWSAARSGNRRSRCSTRGSRPRRATSSATGRR